MSRLDDLKVELLAGHPVTGPYNANDLIAASELNVVNRTQNRNGMSSSEVANAIDVPEFNALAAVDEQKIWNVLHLGELNPFGVEATIFTDVFGGGSITITALAAARKTAVSRGVEIGVGHVREGHVTRARAL